MSVCKTIYTEEGSNYISVILWITIVNFLLDNYILKLIIGLKVTTPSCHFYKKKKDSFL